MQPILLFGFLLFGLSWGQRYLGGIRVDNVGLLNIFEHSSGSGRTRYSVLASSYDTRVNTKDNSYFLQYPGQGIDSNWTSYTPFVLYDQLYWGKEIEQVDRSNFGFDAVVTGDGSTITGKANGQIYVTDIRNLGAPSTNDLTSPTIPSTTSYMYSKVIWKKLNGAFGGPDMLLCRSSYSGGIFRSAQLVYFQRPTLGDELSRSWSPTVLKEAACDTNIAEIVFTINRDDWEVFYTTGIATKRLTMFWPETNRGNPGDWKNPDEVQGLILDEYREFYDVQAVDLNRDGRLDILVSVVSNNGGSVEVWEPTPGNFRDTANYGYHIIAKDFVSRNNGASGRTPGIVRAFFPTRDISGKPWILVAGADDGRAYYLVPNSSHPGDWTYTQQTLADYGTGQTVSGIAQADIDGDGNAEIFVSVHNRNQVDVYTFAP